MARIEVEGIEESIVKAIVAERATFHACTARQLSRRIGYHHSYISEILQKMKQAGIVDFAVEVPGSIHLVGTVEAQWAETQVVDGDGAPMFDPNDAPIMARQLIERVSDAAEPARKSRSAVKLGVDAARMEARLAAKRQARADAAALEVPPAPRVKRAPRAKKAAAPKRAAASS
ncbi:MAG: hypothetical protein KA274_16610 [Ilumatobacteraceae bacterium]|jgi:DNA-binding IscR family transcriptional regulator|nr:hypothetical protein [Ilumatobacteraceae bacterium]